MFHDLHSQKVQKNKQTVFLHEDQFFQRRFSIEPPIPCDKMVKSYTTDE